MCIPPAGVHDTDQRGDAYLLHKRLPFNHFGRREKSRPKRRVAVASDPA